MDSSDAVPEFLDPTVVIHVDFSSMRSMHAPVATVAYESQM